MEGRSEEAATCLVKQLERNCCGLIRSRRCNMVQELAYCDFATYQCIMDMNFYCRTSIIRPHKFHEAYQKKQAERLKTTSGTSPAVGSRYIVDLFLKPTTRLKLGDDVSIPHQPPPCVTASTTVHLPSAIDQLAIPTLLKTQTKHTVLHNDFIRVFSSGRTNTWM
jgi:hypothetical protein